MSHLDRTGHLNDEQFSALLAGENSDALFAAEAHLDACAECRAERERVAGAMESFSGLALEWAERRSATLPPVAVQPRAGWTRPVAWAGVTAALALAIVAGVHHPGQPAAPLEVAQGTASAPMAAEMPGVAPVSPQPARHLTREQQIAEDNRMLLAIRHELTRPETLTLQTSEGRRVRDTRTVND